ncbi:ArnT family glycosyltransferase [Saccharopolyspora rosea]|uniref:ArnT family glycosyltransferase n=1 Tax=Saccharopolyspora rosea TaxID=524884 RepID=A0ABW3FRL3_9PSEU|nr:glycosyltransferase family 39 protein [Saccharopolyspora rosea]
MPEPIPDATRDAERPPVTGAPLPRFARRPVLAVAGATGALLLLISARYGYVTDELYFLAAGRYHLAWGYMDQQPLVPLLAAAADAVAPGFLPLFRLPALVVTVLGVVVAALLAREFGGPRRAQVLAAAAYPLSPWILLNGHWLTAATMEPLQWSTALWLVARWIRLHRAGIHRDRLLLWAGLVVAVAVQTKFQVVVLCAALLAGVAIAGPRALLTRPALWVGAAFAVLTAVPTLAWQARHGWPALDMGTAVNRETTRLGFLPGALFYSGVVVGAVFCCYGLLRLLRAAELRAFRSLGWTAVGVALFFVAAGGRPNYLAGLYGLLFAAAATGLRRPVAARRVLWPAFLLSAVLPVAVLPVYPLSFLARHPEFPSFPRLYETGWPELVATVDRAYRSLPPQTRRRTAIVGESYYLTGALDVLGRRAGLPGAHSPHRGYWFFGAPPDDADAVLYVGSTAPLAPHFAESRRLAVVRSELVNIPQGVSVTLYRHPLQPWSQLWPRLREL